jgi:hypothetical protein
MKRLIVAGIALLVLLSSAVVGSTQEQESQGILDMPAFESPSLTMLVVLDDTQSMRTANFDGDGTDPNDVRGEAVLEIAARLNADQLRNHEMAIFSFGASRVTPLTLGADGSVFSSLGGKDADPAQLSNIKAQLAARTVDSNSGTALRAALITAVAALRTHIPTATASRKIVLVIITDNISSELDEAFVESLKELPVYQEPSCQHNAGKPIVAVFPMGDARNVTGSGGQSLFAERAVANGWLHLDNPVQPFVYPAGGRLQAVEDTRREFHAGIAAFMSEIRCIWPTERADAQNIGTGQQQYTFEMSNLYPQTHVIIKAQPNAVIVIVNGDGTEINDRTTGARLFAQSSIGLQVWSFARDTFSAAWDGIWFVNTSSVAHVAVEHEINPQELEAELVEITNAQPGAPVNYPVQLKAGGKYVTQTDTLSLFLRLQDTSVSNIEGQQLIRLEANGNVFEMPPENRTLESSSYETSTVIEFNRPVRSGFRERSRYLLAGRGRITFGQSVQMVVERPEVGLRPEAWCQNGQQEFRVSFRGTGGDSASVFNYAVVELVFTQAPPTPASSLTPPPPTTILLKWQPNDVANPGDDIFEVALDCYHQLPSGSQVVEIRSRLGDQTSVATRVGAYLAPTPTPTSTPTAPPTAAIVSTIAPPTPIPFPTPTLAPIDVFKGLIDPFTTPPLIYIVLGCVLAFVVIILAFSWRQYRQQWLPLSYITIEYDDLGDPRPLLTGWRAVVPFMQVKSIHEEGKPLLTVKRTEQGEFEYFDRDGKTKLSIDNSTYTVADLQTNRSMDYHFAPYPLFGSVLFTVTCTDNSGKRPNRFKQLAHKIIPYARQRTIFDPYQRLLRIFTISWDMSEHGLQIGAEQTIEVNNREVRGGETYVTSGSRTRIRFENPDTKTYTLYNHRARSNYSEGFHEPA